MKNKKLRLLLATVITSMMMSISAYANFQSGYLVTHLYYNENGQLVGIADWASNCGGVPGDDYSLGGEVTNNYEVYLTPCTQKHDL